MQHGGTLRLDSHAQEGLRLTKSTEAASRTWSQELGREQGVSVEWGQSFSLGRWKVLEADGVGGC